MNVKVDDLGGNMRKLTVEVPFEVLDKATVAVYNRQKGRMNIPGFRKGHAPKQMLEKMYGATVFYEEAAERVINETYGEAAKESGEDIVSRPSVDVIQIEEDKPFIYTAEVAVKPEVTLGEHKGIKVERAVVSVTDEDVEAELKRAQEQNARIVPVEDEDRQVKDGDIVSIDFDGYVDGKQFKGGKGENYPLTIGSHSFVDTFEEQLIGCKAGDETEVHVTFPENYQSAELAGAQAMFKVVIHEIREKQLPDIDDEFASEVSEFETLEEYKEDIRKMLKTRAEKRAAAENENNVVKAVVAGASMDIPEAMIETRIDNMMDDYARRLQMQGLKLEQYLKFTGMDEAAFRAQLRDQAVDSIKTRLVLETVVKKEELKVAPETLENEIEGMAKQYKLEVDALKKMLSPEELKAMELDLCCQEAIDFLVAEAELTEA